MSKVLYRSLLIVSILLLIAAVVVFSFGFRPQSGPPAILAMVGLAFWIRSKEHWKSLAFTLWILASATTCMYYPEAFISWGGFELKKLIVPVIQFIMFGMGTTLCVSDFVREAKMPRAILIGMVLQFSVMPAIGLLLAKGLGLDPMVAVGVILVGSCPGGVASNVITYIARGNVALSVTMTACSTVVSPVMTPLMMKLLAQQYTHIDFVAMMLSILKMVLVPG